MARRTPGPLTSDVLLRDVIESDLQIFFDQQLDSDANHMAAFTTRDPANRDAFAAHWTRILGDETITIKTILFDGHVAGYVLIYEDEEFGKPEVSYWIGKNYCGKGRGFSNARGEEVEEFILRLRANERDEAQ